MIFATVPLTWLHAIFQTLTNCQISVTKNLAIKKEGLLQIMSTGNHANTLATTSKLYTQS